MPKDGFLYYAVVGQRREESYGARPVKYSLH
jgi:hypothetical protein